MGLGSLPIKQHTPCQVEDRRVYDLTVYVNVKTFIQTPYLAQVVSRLASWSGKLLSPYRLRMERTQTYTDAVELII